MINSLLRHLAALILLGSGKMWTFGDADARMFKSWVRVSDRVMVRGSNMVKVEIVIILRIMLRVTIRVSVTLSVSASQFTSPTSSPLHSLATY